MRSEVSQALERTEHPITRSGGEREHESYSNFNIWPLYAGRAGNQYLTLSFAI